MSLRFHHERERDPDADYDRMVQQEVDEKWAEERRKAIPPVDTYAIAAKEDECSATKESRSGASIQSTTTTS